jgi:hypothetical protein
MKAFFDHFAAILGALTITLLLMSISHEYGYFTLMGRNFQTLLTATDYLSNAILWSPWLLIIILTAEWQKLNYVVPERQRNWRNWRTWRAPVLVGIWFTFLIATSSWPPYPFGMVSFIIVVIWIWSRLWTKFYKPIEGLGDDLNAIYRDVIKIGPPLLVVMFLWGWIEASNDLENVNDPYIVSFKGRANPELRILLRTFDRGLLMRNAVSGRVEFHKWGNVEGLQRHPSGRAEPFACYLVEFFCSKSKRESSPPPM